MITPTLDIERSLWNSGKHLVCGIDEVGRGCFAGPVSAAAVILPKNFYHPELNDSKQLTAEQREIRRQKGLPRCERRQRRSGSVLSPPVCLDFPDLLDECHAVDLVERGLSVEDFLHSRLA